MGGGGPPPQGGGGLGGGGPPPGGANLVNPFRQKCVADTTSEKKDLAMASPEMRMLDAARQRAKENDTVVDHTVDDDTTRRRLFHAAIDDGAFTYISSNPWRFFSEAQRALPSLPPKPASSSSSSSSASSAFKTEMCPFFYLAFQSVPLWQLV